MFHHKPRAVLLVTVLVLSVVAAGVTLSGTVVASHSGDTIVVDDDGGEDFERIQDAIDHASPGDTVEIKPGTYTPDATIDVDKEGLAIVGVGDVTVYSDDRTIDPIIEISADGTTVEGLTVESGPSLGAGLAPYEIHVFDGAEDVEIVDNEIVRNADSGHPSLHVGDRGGSVVDGNDGVRIVGNDLSQASNIAGFAGDGDTITVEDNVVGDGSIYFTGSGFGALPSSAEIDYDDNGPLAVVHPGDHQNGWFVASSDLQGVVDNDVEEGGTVWLEPGTHDSVDISKSVSLVGVEGPSETVIEGGSDNAVLLTGHTDELNDIEVRGITLRSDDAAGLIAFSDGNTDFDTTNLVVSNVVVEDTVSGIYVFDARNVEISASEITGVEGAAIAMAGVQNVEVSGNDIADNGAGVSVGVGNPESVYPDNEDVRVNDNDIDGNDVGVFNGDEGLTVDATDNYWGHASGPGGSDGRVNPAGKQVGKGDDIEGDVDFDPWLRQPADT